MPRKKTNVFLMNYPLDNRGSNKIKIASWTAEQKDNFLNAIRTQRAGYYVAPCAFSIHFDTYVIHARSFDRPKTFTPHISKNKPNEIIIEIIPDVENCDCWTSLPISCPDCIKRGGCDSVFIKGAICNVLFPNAYKGR